MKIFIPVQFWFALLCLLVPFSSVSILSDSYWNEDALLWVYVGSTKGGEFRSPYFDITQPPIKGQSLTPTTTMSLRASAPETKDGIRIRAKRISFLWPDMSFLVMETVAQDSGTGSTYHWAGGELHGGYSFDQQFDNDWFVVVASEAKLEDATARAEEMKRADQDLDVEVYISENKYYAVVIGSGLTQSEAKRRVLNAEKRGLVSDAYIWPSKKWGDPLLSLK